MPCNHARTQHANEIEVADRHLDELYPSMRALQEEMRQKVHCKLSWISH